jgi:NAD(P)-dependent dehydrogenase (short-subunit alcohol dehydrogenase family)
MTDVRTNGPGASGSMSGQVAVVTGSGRNIGFAIARQLAAEGATVVVNDVVGEAAEQAAAAIRGRGDAALAVAGDMSRSADVEAVFKAAEAYAGTVSVLVNNAYWPGLPSLRGSLLTIDEDDWRSFVDTNMAIFFLSSRRAARAMVAHGVSGSIVTIGSHGALRAHRNRIAYDAVKGALDSFTRATALDLAPWGIRVNSIRPGAIGVDHRLDGSPDPRTATADQIPLGRLGVGADIAATAVFLASRSSAYITGQSVTVDGGLGAQARPPALEPSWSPDVVGLRQRIAEELALEDAGS